MCERRGNANQARPPDWRLPLRGNAKRPGHPGVHSRDRGQRPCGNSRTRSLDHSSHVRKLRVFSRTTRKARSHVDYPTASARTTDKGQTRRTSTNPPTGQTEENSWYLPQRTSAQAGTVGTSKSAQSAQTNEPCQFTSNVSRHHRGT